VFATWELYALENGLSGVKTHGIVLTGLALVAVGCGGGGSQPPAASSPQTVTDTAGGGIGASCAAGFNWNVRFYALNGGKLEKPLVMGEELGRGVQPACNDMGGQSVAPDEAVTVFRIEGVEPETAVARLGDDRPYFNLMPAA
jgi:Family of unknown function (DUF6281)